MKGKARQDKTGAEWETKAKLTDTHGAGEANVEELLCVHRERRAAAHEEAHFAAENLAHLLEDDAIQHGRVESCVQRVRERRLVQLTTHRNESRRWPMRMHISRHTPWRSLPRLWR